MRILIIEDEKKIAEVIANRLKKEHYAVDVSYDGENGSYNALSDIYDLIILDIMLPKKNGIDILKEIKKNHIKARVIMLTAKSQLEDKLEGFEYGADDYLTKPFHLDELVARVHVQLKNNHQSFLQMGLEYGDIILDTKKSTVTCTSTEEKIDIIGKEFLLLEYFIQNKEQIVTREQIYNKVWGYDNEAESNNLEAYLSFVRKKLKLIGSNVQIKAIRGMGYKLVMSDEKIKD